jgi:hypothetical protein
MKEHFDVNIYILGFLGGFFNANPARRTQNLLIPEGYRIFHHRKGGGGQLQNRSTPGQSGHKALHHPRTFHHQQDIGPVTTREVTTREDKGHVKTRGIQGTSIPGSFTTGGLQGLSLPGWILVFSPPWGMQGLLSPGGDRACPYQGGYRVFHQQKYAGPIAARRAAGPVTSRGIQGLSQSGWIQGSVDNHACILLRIKNTL